MGGKSYYCDYCCCFLKNDFNVRKTHNSGLTHKMAKIRYMRRYEDPKKVFDEESKKEPCLRYLSGRYCKFDLVCNSTHFNKKQLQQLKDISEHVEKIHKRKTSSYEQKAVSKILPWQYSNDLASGKRSRLMINRLPESLKPINFYRMSNNFISNQ